MLPPTAAGSAPRSSSILLDVSPSRFNPTIPEHDPAPERLSGSNAAGDNELTSLIFKYFTKSLFLKIN